MSLPLLFVVMVRLLHWTLKFSLLFILIMLWLGSYAELWILSYFLSWKCCGWYAGCPIIWLWYRWTLKLPKRPYSMVWPYFTFPFSFIPLWRLCLNWLFGGVNSVRFPENWRLTYSRKCYRYDWNPLIVVLVTSVVLVTWLFHQIFFLVTHLKSYI